MAKNTKKHPGILEGSTSGGLMALDGRHLSLPFGLNSSYLKSTYLGECPTVLLYVVTIDRHPQVHVNYRTCKASLCLILSLSPCVETALYGACLHTTSTGRRQTRSVRGDNITCHFCLCRQSLSGW